MSSCRIASVRRLVRASVVLGALLATLLPAVPAAARVRVLFTSRGDDAPGAIVQAMRAAERRAQAGRPATIDIAIFSFTHYGIADELVRIAAQQPGVQVRLILDLSQISHSQLHVGPYIEDLQQHQFRDACTLRLRSPSSAELSACEADLRALLGSSKLENVQVKYKWYDGYVWDARSNRPRLEHTRSLLMHRKLAIINGDTLLAGSFNWSPQAAKDNYENLMVLSGRAERRVIDAYRAEFDGMWNDAASFKTGAECRALRQQIWDRLRNGN